MARLAEHLESQPSACLVVPRPPPKHSVLPGLMVAALVGPVTDLPAGHRVCAANDTPGKATYECSDPHHMPMVTTRPHASVQYEPPEPAAGPASSACRGEVVSIATFNFEMEPSCHSCSHHSTVPQLIPTLRTGLESPGCRGTSWQPGHHSAHRPQAVQCWLVPGTCTVVPAWPGLSGVTSLWQ